MRTFEKLAQAVLLDQLLDRILHTRADPSVFVLHRLPKTTDLESQSQGVRTLAIDSEQEIGVIRNTFAREGVVAWDEAEEVEA